MDHDTFTGKFVGPSGVLAISGEIERGDYERLLERILDDEDRFLSADRIIIAGNGGDVSESLRIAELVRSLHVTLSVGPLTGRCSAACFLVFAAADEREVDGEGQLGVSGIEAPPGAKVALDGDFLTATRIRQLIGDNDVPMSIARYLLRSPIDGVHWLSPDEETALPHRSAAFVRYLRVRCAWNNAVEGAVLTGRRPVADMESFWQCRKRSIRADAHSLLAGVRRQRQPAGHLPGR